MQLNRMNDPFVKHLQHELRNCKTVLDLGCGQSSMIQYVPNIEFSLGVEIWKPYIEESQKNNIHTKYINSDILSFHDSPDSFDAVMCIDVIEHIEKEKALELIKAMKEWATEKVIILTPNGYIPNENSYGDGNKYQNHLSGWTPLDFYNLGFDVVGFGGWSRLRGEMGEIISTGITRDICAVISKLSEPFCRMYPKYAFSICAVYMVED
jgi:SAM-dependent methyltransferase